MKAFLVGLLVLAASAAQAKIQVFATGDIAAMQQNEKGTYDVICKNGNRENVTDLDLSLGNVCPNRTSSEPTNILSLQLRSDGNFDVVCKDMSKVVASPEDVMAGKVCKTAPPAKAIKDGTYSSPNSGLCNQTLVAGYNTAGLEKLTLGFLSPCSSGDGIVVACSGKVCSGVHGPTGQTIAVTVVDETHYEWLNKTYGGGPSVFALIGSNQSQLPQLKALPHDNSGSPAGHR
jgi:hypothetical protein